METSSNYLKMLDNKMVIRDNVTKNKFCEKIISSTGRYVFDHETHVLFVRAWRQRVEKLLIGVPQPSGGLITIFY